MKTSFVRMIVVLLVVGFLRSMSVADQPNIIFIMADDLGYGDLGCYGQKLIRTPNIDRLAAEGLKFTQAYAGSSVCAPTRAILMTGIHGGHAAVRDNIPHYDTYLRDHDVTVAEVLQEVGYRCGGVGKWSLGDAGTAGRATNQGFDMWFGYLNQDHAHHYFTDYLDDNEGRLELPGNPKSRRHYSHDLMTERSLRFIRDSKDGPFFFYGAYTLPHFSTKKEDPTGLAVPSDAPYSDEDWSPAEKNYAAMVTRLDRDVGRIVALIDELALTQKTLIIFSSDNGPWGSSPKKFESGGPLRGRKRDSYEGGIRVPFIARWPGTIAAGSSTEEIIAFWDLLPTFAEIAGARPPENIDGISIVDALKGGKIAQPHEYFYWDYGHCRSRYDQAVRMGDWKAVRRGQKNEIELYDLSNDIGERNNIAAQQPEVVQKIAEIMTTAVTPSERYPVGERYRKKASPKPPRSMRHVFAYSEPGRFAGWPANNGAWSWGKEIVVGFALGWYKLKPTGHAIDGKRGSSDALARSLDGGETWNLEDPKSFASDGGKTVPNLEGIHFTHPDFAMRISGGRFSVSYDRAKTWRGPYALTGLDFRLSARTDYLVIDDDECLVFLSAKLPEVNGSNHNDRAFMARTTDGGKTFQFVSWLTGDPVKVRSVMPSTVRISDKHLVTITRRKVRDPQRKYQNWIEASVSRDFGQSWSFLSRVADTDRGEENGSPPALVQLADGRLVVSYGYRSQPLGIRAKLSHDQGQTWGVEISLRNDGSTWDLGYPRMVLRPDGKLVTMYYFNTAADPEQHIVTTIWDPDAFNRPSEKTQ